MLGAHEVIFPALDGTGRVRGVVHTAEGVQAAVLLAHGRSNDMDNPLVRRLSLALSGAGAWTLHFNFRYVDENGSASKDLSREADDLLAAVRFARKQVPGHPLFLAGLSMGARVGARASADPDIAGLIALGYPLHPPGRPEVRDPPEWPKLVKPALFVQGDRDPFCDLERLHEELPRLAQPHELAVIRNAGHTFEPKGVKRDTFPEVFDAVLAWIRRQVGS